MTILLTDSLGSFQVKEKNMAWKLREESLKQPITTLYKVRTGNQYRLLMKTGRNNFLDMQDKSYVPYARHFVRCGYHTFPCE